MSTQALSVCSNVQFMLKTCKIRSGMKLPRAQTSHAAADLLQSLDVGIITQACETTSKT